MFYVGVVFYEYLGPQGWKLQEGNSGKDEVRLMPRSREDAVRRYAELGVDLPFEMPSDADTVFVLQPTITYDQQRLFRWVTFHIATVNEKTQLGASFRLGCDRGKGVEQIETELVFEKSGEDICAYKDDLKSRTGSFRFENVLLPPSSMRLDGPLLCSRVQMTVVNRFCTTAGVYTIRVGSMVDGSRKSIGPIELQPEARSPQSTDICFPWDRGGGTKSHHLVAELVDQHGQVVHSEQFDVPQSRIDSLRKAESSFITAWRQPHPLAPGGREYGGPYWTDKVAQLNTRTQPNDRMQVRAACEGVSIGPPLSPRHPTGEQVRYLLKRDTSLSVRVTAGKEFTNVFDQRITHGFTQSRMIKDGLLTGHDVLVQFVGSDDSNKVHGWYWGDMKNGLPHGYGAFYADTLSGSWARLRKGFWTQGRFDRESMIKDIAEGVATQLDLSKVFGASANVARTTDVQFATFEQDFIDPSSENGYFLQFTVGWKDLGGDRYTTWSMDAVDFYADAEPQFVSADEVSTAHYMRVREDASSQSLLRMLYSAIAESTVGLPSQYDEVTRLTTTKNRCNSRFIRWDCADGVDAGEFSVQPHWCSREYGYDRCYTLNVSTFVPTDSSWHNLGTFSFMEGDQGQFGHWNVGVVIDPIYGERIGKASSPDDAISRIVAKVRERYPAPEMPPQQVMKSDKWNWSEAVGSDGLKEEQIYTRILRSPRFQFDPLDTLHGAWYTRGNAGQDIVLLIDRSDFFEAGYMIYPNEASSDKQRYTLNLLSTEFAYSPEIKALVYSDSRKPELKLQRVSRDTVLLDNGEYWVRLGRYLNVPDSVCSEGLDLSAQRSVRVSHRAHQGGTAKSTRALLEEKVQAAQNVKDEVAAWYAALKAKPNVRSTPSGILYEIVEPGSGRKSGSPPKYLDRASCYMVERTYRNELISESTRGNRIHVIGRPSTPIWLDEGLQLMPEGAKYKFYVLPELAYGAQGKSERRIPPSCGMMYEITMSEITRSGTK